jgi:hypothetical protein
MAVLETQGRWGTYLKSPYTDKMNGGSAFLRRNRLPFGVLLVRVICFLVMAGVCLVLMPTEASCICCCLWPAWTQYRLAERFDDECDDAGGV